MIFVVVAWIWTSIFRLFLDFYIIIAVFGIVTIANAIGIFMQFRNSAIAQVAVSLVAIGLTLIPQNGTHWTAVLRVFLLASLATSTLVFWLLCRKRVR